MVNAKKKCNLIDNIDVPGICMEYAASVYEFCGLDDMHLLMNNKYVYNGVAYSRLCHGESVQDKSSVYFNYLLDALYFLYINKVNLDNKITSFRDDSSEYYCKYIKYFYGNKYESDGNIMSMAICQSSNFLVSAWDTISQSGLEDSFKKFIRDIYY